jgi:hypothetical protein
MTPRSSSSSPDETGTVEAKSRGRLTRRQALESGAVALGAFAFDTDPAAARTMKKKEHGSMPAGRFLASFDAGWLFHRGDVSGGQAPAFDDSSWRKLDVPHDWQIEDLPYAPADADGGTTADPSGFAFETGGSSNGTPPAVIGPLDAQKGTSGQGYTVVGVGWYRKHFTVPSLPIDERESRCHRSSCAAAVGRGMNATARNAAVGGGQRPRLRLCFGGCPPARLISTVSWAPSLAAGDLARLGSGCEVGAQEEERYALPQLVAPGRPIVLPRERGAGKGKAG